MGGLAGHPPIRARADHMAGKIILVQSLQGFQALWVFTGLQPVCYRVNSLPGQHPPRQKPLTFPNGAKKKYE
jgi:hypothetical protein